VESRRDVGTRGGLATYIKKPIKIEASNSNEYGIHTKVILPNSTRINIINVYIPPITSLTKRNITEQSARLEIETLLDTI
jgi:hypothetical protein